jgi:hypothetical protein
MGFIGSTCTALPPGGIARLNASAAASSSAWAFAFALRSCISRSLIHTPSPALFTCSSGLTNLREKIVQGPG